MTQETPKVTIGILSWNRLHYLKATLESARVCIEYPNLEWIVVDNESDEPGLAGYIEACDWINHKVFRKQSHAEAMNQLVDMSKGEFLLIWPEDVQFTVKGDWMTDIVEIMDRHDFIGSMCLDYMRKVTIRNIFSPSILRNPRRFVDEILRYGIRFRRRRLVESSRLFKVRTFGWFMEGVCGSGLPSLTRTQVWRDLGPWRVTEPRQKRLEDSSLGAEEDMIRRFYQSRKLLQRAIPLIPVAADIITDPTGCKAKVRGRFRYGVYMPPPEGTFYYKIRDLEKLKSSYDGELPMTFSEGVIPLGFEIPVDESGDRLKSSINMSVKYDMKNRRYIPYPLQTQ